MIQTKMHLRDIYRSEPDRFDRTHCLRLDKNEDLCGLPEDLVRSCLSKITPADLSAYPQPYILHDKLCDYLGVSRESILITMGSDAAIKNTFEVFISPGDGVIIPDPTYAMYEVYASLFEADLTKISYSDDLNLSIDEIKRAIRDNTRLIALANPNSPTGTIISRDKIINLLQYCKSRDILVLIDEAYHPFYPNTVIDLINCYPNLIVTRTFSKAFGLAALRLGYAVSHPSLIRCLATFRPIYETHGFAVILGCAVLDNQQVVTHNVEKTFAGRDYLVCEMKRLGFDAYTSHCNFVNFKVGEHNRDRIVEYLKTKKILIKPGADHPALRSCIRITVGPKETMAIAVQAIEEYLNAEQQKNRIS